ncbi:MAG TPA: hypothetical protein VFT47_15045 [Vicinamibacterales bacterium]|nr:hypothetical protein [Vicinamibacterales bacterium]
MGRGRTWQAAVVASLSVSGAFLGAAAPIPEVSHGQSADEVVALTTSQNLLATDPTALRRFVRTSRPAPVSSENKARALTALPLAGAVTHLSASARQKLAALTTLLRSTERELERLGTANNESDYPTLAQRQVFARAMVARSVEATAEVPVELDLRVTAHATLDAVELERTSETVQRLLTAAGVLSRWRDCSGAGCRADPGSVAIDVLLLPMTKLTERDVYGEVAHDAITGAPTVLIYVPPIADRVRAIRSSIDGRSNPALATMQTGHLVGAAIAHEVGHALGLRHAARGVMKGRLTVDDALALRTSRLVFTSSEGATMRSTLRTARNSVGVAAR